MNELVLSNKNSIENKIYTIRGVQVMLDRDLALLYDVETRTLKQAVKRNIEKFPDDFMFELTDNEIDFMVSQLVIPSKKYFGGAKPFVFTEHGVSMLTSVLKSAIATKMSINIIRTFINMRKFLISNASIFQRLDSLEIKQLQNKLESDEKFNKIFNAIEEKGVPQKQHIFYEGQIFDAYLFLSDIIKSAKYSIKLIDNYVDESTLVLFTKRDINVKMTIHTNTISQQLQLDLKKHNVQYPSIEIKKFDLSHDRFLIIDEKEIYHFGASLKDLGKKWFAVSKMDIDSFKMLEKL
ncbi:MAG: ORF6N domain-containing protein [Arcobacteraceae bacterium]